MLVVLGLLLVGCGQTAATPRAQMASYLRRVNLVERELEKPLLTVTNAGARFSRDQRVGSSGGAAFDELSNGPAQALNAAEGQVRALRVRLAAIPAPAAAFRLRRLLLRLVDAQVVLTRMTTQLVVFLPRFGTVMRPLGPAITQLERVLSVNQALGTAAVQAVYAQKEAALLGFKAALDRMSAALRRLDPPEELRPAYATQLRAVEGMSQSAGGLAAALQGSEQAQISRLLTSFDAAAAGPQSLSTQEAEIRALRAYDAQLTQLNHLSEQAQRQWLQLSRTLH